MELYSHLVKDDTAYISIRLSKEAYLSLRQFMHTEDGAIVSFPHGVHLNSRSMGWYRLNASNTYRAIDKLTLSRAIIRKWFKDFKSDTVLPKTKAPQPIQQIRVTTSVSNELLQDSNFSLQQRLASPAKLNQLVAKFAR